MSEEVRVFFPRSQFKHVEEFHEAFDLPIGDHPQLLSDERWALRKRLIREEYRELLEAVTDKDLTGAAKELADLAYVVNGLAVEMGIDLDVVVRKVHRSNMSKLGEDGKPIYRSDGKVLKGPYYQEPDIAQVLYR